MKQQKANTINIKVRRGALSGISLKLAPSACIHIMGIGGVAMSALAGLLKEKGYKVQGSDKNFYPPAGEELKKLNIPLIKGYGAKNIHPGLDLVIVGNVISKHFPATQALLKSKIPYISLPEALNSFVIKGPLNQTASSTVSVGQTIMVCGTHGKTTVSCLVAHVLRECGLDPGFMIGGVSENFKKGFHINRSSWFVLEGDEYDTAFFEKTPKFIHYHADYILLNNIEFDHADIYPNKEAVIQAFKPLIKKVKTTGALLIANEECSVTRDLVAVIENKNTYGIQKGGWQLIKRTSLGERGQILQVQNKQTKKKVEIQIPLPGEHNGLNALAVWVLACALKLNQKKVLLAFKSFLGTRRRFQVLGAFSGRVLIEDFAHHPTAVKAVLRSAKEMYPDQRILALFEPRSNTSQRNIFQKQYEQALSLADLVFCMEAPKSDLLESERFSAKKLVNNINKSYQKAFYACNIEKMAHLVKNHSLENDIIIMMSNGDFGGLIPLLKRILSDIKKTFKPNWF